MIVPDRRDVNEGMVVRSTGWRNLMEPYPTRPTVKFSRWERAEWSSFERAAMEGLE